MSTSDNVNPTGVQPTPTEPARSEDSSEVSVAAGGAKHVPAHPRCLALTFQALRQKVKSRAKSLVVVGVAGIIAGFFALPVDTAAVVLWQRMLAAPVIVSGTAGVALVAALLVLALGCRQLRLCAEVPGPLTLEGTQAWWQRHVVIVVAIPLATVLAPFTVRLFFGAPAIAAWIMAGVALALSVSFWTFLVVEVSEHSTAVMPLGRKLQGIAAALTGVVLAASLATGAVASERKPLPPQPPPVRPTTTTSTSTTVPPPPPPTTVRPCPIGPGDGVTDEAIAAMMKAASHRRSAADYGCLKPVTWYPDGTWVQEFEDSPAFLIGYIYGAGVVNDLVASAIRAKTQGNLSVHAIGGVPLNGIDCGTQGPVGDFHAVIDSEGVIKALSGRQTKSGVPIRVDDKILAAFGSELAARGHVIFPVAAARADADGLVRQAFVDPVTSMSFELSSGKSSDALTLTAGSLYKKCNAGQQVPSYLMPR